MSSRSTVHVIGTGRYASAFLATLLDAGYDVAAIFDDDPTTWGAASLSGIPVLGPIDSVKQHERLPAIIALVDNRLRKAIAEQYDLDWLTVVHPKACIDSSVELGQGTIIFPGSVLQPNTRVGDHVIVNTAASIDHDCVIEDFVHIAARAHLADHARVGEGGCLGIGSILLPNVSVDPWTIVEPGTSVPEQSSQEAVGVAVPHSPLQLDHSTVTLRDGEEVSDNQRATQMPDARELDVKDDDSDRIYLSPPHMTLQSRELLIEAFDSNWIAPCGPHGDAFEQEFAAKIGTSHGIALSSGTAGLHLALLALGVGRGDEVLTSTLTFAATANVITYVGAKPVFVDSDYETWNMDPELLAEELEIRAKRGQLPKAVIAVDLYGQCADYDRIAKTCRFYGVPLIEDAAEALGASFRDRPAGTFGDIGVFSFNGNKIITTSGGGMLVTDREDLAEQIRSLANQAREPVAHYEHAKIGYNYRMSNLLAAVGRGQLGVLDERVAERRTNFTAYREAIGHLPGVDFMPEISGGRSTRWLTCMTIEPDKLGTTSETIRLEHERQNIESRPIWKPMHLQPVFADCQVVGGSVAEDLFRRGLCLPSGSNLTGYQRERVINVILAMAETSDLPDSANSHEIESS